MPHLPPATETPSITPLGDAALLLTFASVISRTAARTVQQATQRMLAAQIPGVTDVVPAYGTLAVYYDPSQTSYAAVHAAATATLAQHDATSDEERPDIIIPVRYDGADLADVAERTGMSVAEVVECHITVRYYVYMLGFVPGFAYLGDLDPALVLPRRTDPRQRVPSGSVAIAGAQTAIYPLSTPGGWHILGTTDTVMFDAQRASPAFLRAGDRVRFTSVPS